MNSFINRKLERDDMINYNDDEFKSYFLQLKDGFKKDNSESKSNLSAKSESKNSFKSSYSDNSCFKKGKIFAHKIAELSEDYVREAFLCLKEKVQFNLEFNKFPDRQSALKKLNEVLVQVREETLLKLSELKNFNESENRFLCLLKSDKVVASGEIDIMINKITMTDFSSVLTEAGFIRAFLFPEAHHNYADQTEMNFSIEITTNKNLVLDKLFQLFKNFIIYEFFTSSTPFRPCIFITGPPLYVSKVTEKLRSSQVLKLLPESFLKYVMIIHKPLLSHTTFNYVETYFNTKYDEIKMENSLLKAEIEVMKNENSLLKTDMKKMMRTMESFMKYLPQASSNEKEIQELQNEKKIEDYDQEK
jgi:hypothetical protein